VLVLVSVTSLVGAAGAQVAVVTPTPVQAAVKPGGTPPSPTPTATPTSVPSKPYAQPTTPLPAPTKPQGASSGALSGAPSAGAPMALSAEDGPIISVSPATVFRGATVTVSWLGIANPTTKDWFSFRAISEADAPGPASDWRYVDRTQSGNTARAAGTCSFTLSLNRPAGDYEFRLYANDTFTRLAISNVLHVDAGTITANKTAVRAGDTMIVAWNGIGTPTAKRRAHGPEQGAHLGPRAGALGPRLGAAADR
jgi:hypothetical protein